MTSWAAWLVLLVVVVTLGAIATHFSMRTLRWLTAVVAVALVIVVTAYGLNSAVSLGMPASGPPDLQTAFAKGADAIAAALVRPLWLGHQVPEPGRVGWAVIGVLLLLGYRQLEAWALARQAPVVDTSQLSDGQPSILADAAAHPGLTDGQRHDQLAAELKFRLAAMELRAPAILPGGSRSSGRRVDRRGQRDNRSRAGRSDHPVLRAAVAWARAVDAAGVGRAATQLRAG